MTVMNWLFKEEPSNYSFDAFVKDGSAVWSGVRNPVAQRNLHAVKKGDRVFYYHTGDEKAVIGVAKAVSDPYPDPKLDDPRRVVVDVAPVRALENPVALSTFRTDAVLATTELVRISRLSVMPITAAHLARIEKLAKG